MQRRVGVDATIPEAPRTQTRARPRPIDSKLARYNSGAQGGNADDDVLTDMMRILEFNPWILCVIVLLPCSVVYLALWCVLPQHSHDKFPTVSYYMPIVCVAGIIFSLMWIIDPSATNWLKLPVTLFRSAQRANKEGKRFLSTTRLMNWWRWRKRDLLPTMSPKSPRVLSGEGF